MGLYVSFEYRITTLKSFELTFKKDKLKQSFMTQKVVTEPSSTHYRQEENTWQRP